MKFRKAFGELSEILDEFPVIALVGARQCGKTTTAKMVGETLNKPVLYPDSELSSDLAKLNEAGLFLKEHKTSLWS